MGERLTYERPKLIPLNGDVERGRGNCVDGSGDAGVCQNGNWATTQCDDGAAAPGWCKAGISAGTNCGAGSGN